jgi:glutamyl-tRNA synthetase
MFSERFMPPMSASASAKPVVTRFAPSPTGYLHIGGARTALFNWLYARGRGGKFLLRIEDTDRERSTPEATEAILKGLTWLGLDWDGDVVSQFTRKDRHAEVAWEMLKRGSAYKCFSTQEEIEAFREAARAEGRSTLFQSPWRDADPATYPDRPFVIRLKAPRDGQTVINDQVQGNVTFGNEQLDDMVCLRSDGTPTYMLAVVVDDHDMDVTHVIRGDDHLTNAARQTQIYHAMDWPVPVWAHIPLIHGPDGKKLSKRHGAVGLHEYQTMGYPASAMRNYLCRLGWSHGDDEFFTDSQAKEWFDLSGIGVSPSRLDFKKLENLSGQHIAAAADAQILPEIEAFLKETGKPPLSERQRDRMARGLYSLKERAKTFPELLDKAHFLMIDHPVVPDEQAAKALDTVSRGILSELTPQLQNVSWVRSDLEATVAATAAAHGIGLGKLAGPLRAALATFGDKSLSLPILKPTVGPDVIDIRKLYADGDVFTYDPGFTSTAACDSTITYIDGDKGELLVSRLSDRPAGRKVDITSKPATCSCTANCRPTHNWPISSSRVTRHTMVHEQMHNFFRGFRRDSHPMATMVASWARCRPSITTRRHQRSVAARGCGDPDDCQAADHRGDGIQVFDRPALRLSEELARLCVELPATCASRFRARNMW